MTLTVGLWFLVDTIEVTILISFLTDLRMTINGTSQTFLRSKRGDWAALNRNLIFGPYSDQDPEVCQCNICVSVGTFLKHYAHIHTLAS